MIKKFSLIGFIVLCIVIFGTSCTKEEKVIEDEKERISFLHYFSNSLSTGGDSLVDSFNSMSTKYELVSTPLDHEAFKTSIKEGLQGNNPPDLYSYWAGARTKSVLEYIEPIDELWNDKKLDEVFPKAIVDSACTYDGKKYLLPITQHYIGIFYNKKIFNDLNLKEPTNWKEFINVCEKIKEADITPIALGAKNKWPAQFWFDYLLLRTAGYDYREGLMEGMSNYNNREVKKVFEIWNDMIQKGYFNENPNELDWEYGANDLVYNGEAAMTLMGSWLISYYENEEFNWEQGKDYDMFSFPTMDNNIERAALGVIDGIVIPKGAVNIDGGKEVLYYLSTNSSQKAMSLGSGALAPNTNIEKSFYSQIQNKIIDEIEKCSQFAFNYDLSTKPELAELGLGLFKKFLQFPNHYERLLEDMNEDVQNRLIK
jgi:ABC-type glycerol-3-phosphate transport system substrate-binding protein